MKRLIWIFLLASASSQTFNTDLLPAQSGLKLGRAGQRWNLYASNIDITGSITVNGVAGHFTIYPLFGAGHTAVSTDLTSSTPGQCAFWIAGNMLGQGPCLTAVPTPTLGDCAVWSTATTLSSLPCAGGGGSGDIKSLPVSTQTITQPQNTVLAPNNLQQVRYATNFQWTQSPTSPATIAIGANTVTINGVLGVNAYSVSKVKHYLWIATQGTPERVLITATTCTGVNSGTCTVTFTATGTHSAGYTIGTATGGWQEAWVDAFPTTITGIPNVMMASKVVGSPTNDKTARYRFNAPLDIDMQRGAQAPVLFDFQGSVIECFTSGLACIEIDTGTAGTQYLQPEGLTLENALMMTVLGMGRTADGSSKAIWDKGQKTVIRNFHFDSWGNVGDVFDDLIVIDDDQMATIDHAIMNPGDGPPLTCDATYCGSGIKGTTTNSGAVGYIHNSDLSMQCKGNGVDWQSGNSLSVNDTVVQAYNQFGVRAAGAFDTNPAVNLDNVYQEVGSCTNPLGTGTSGLIVQGGWGTKRGGPGGSAGKLQSFTASAAGATQFNYYVVPKSSTLGTGTALLTGYCLSNGTGTCSVKFNQVGSSGTMTWDLIRSTGNLSATSLAPYTAGCAGGSVSACGSVATGITTASCSNNVCTVSDDVTANSTSYTVLAAPTFFPRLDLWPGAIVLAPRSDTNNVHIGSSVFMKIDKTGTGTTTGGIVSTAGRRSISIIADLCTSLNAWNSGYISCQALDATTAGVDTIAEIKQWGGTTGKKGRTIYELDPVTTAGVVDLITLVDTDPALTAATPGNRPLASANDTAIGLDMTAGVLTGSRLGLRAPVGHRRYVGSLFDNSSWTDDLSSTLYSLKVPIAFQSGVTYNLSGPEVSAPSSPAAGLQRSYFKAGVGICSKDSAGVEYCPSGVGAGNVSNSGTPTSGQIPVWQSATTISGVTNLTLPGDVYPKGRPHVDVRAYGALGNNSADDTTAIQNAIAAASNLGTISSLPYSAELFFPCGNYLISAPLILPRSTSDTNANGIVKIRGESKACVWITASAGFPTQRSMIEWDQTVSHRTLGQEISGITFKEPAVDRVRAIHYQYTATNTPVTTSNAVAERTEHLWLHDLEFQGSNQYQDYHIYIEGDAFQATMERLYADDARASGGAINNVYETVTLKTDTCYGSTAPWDETCGFMLSNLDQLGQIGNRGGYTSAFQGRLNQSTLKDSWTNGMRGGFANSYGFWIMNSYNPKLIQLGNEGLGDTSQFRIENTTQCSIEGMYPGAAGNQGFGIGDAINFVATSQCNIWHVTGKAVTQQAFNLQQIMTSYSGLSGGSGYSSAPTWTTTGGNCTIQPAGTTTIAANAVATLVITNGGNCQNIPVIAFSGGGGSGASASATMTGAGTYYNVKLDANSHQNTFWNLHQNGVADVSFSDTSTNFAQSCDQATSACATYFSIGKMPGASFASPTVDSFANANHNHTNAAGGGQLGVSAVSATGTPSSTTFWRGDNTWASATITIASGTASLGTSAIGSGACASAVTVAATGTATTDNIMSDFNTDPTGVTGYAPTASGILTIIKYPTANNVNFKVCNNSSGSITPGAITLNWRVVR